MMKIVEKKILPRFFKDVVTGIKTFELRRDEDNIEVGDHICLKEFDGLRYTGEKVMCEAIYILKDCEPFGLRKGFVIIGIKLLEEAKPLPKIEKTAEEN